MVNNEKLNETYLGFIQSIISRMAQNSFQAKAWGITIVSALLAFYLGKDAIEIRDIIICISCVVVLLFCILDTYYLYLERGYRYLYNVVVGVEKSNKKIIEYDLRIPEQYRGIKNGIKALFSFSTGLFYSIIGFFLLILKVVLK